MDKNQEYTQYIIEHQEHVKLAWENLIPKLTGEFWIDDYTYWNIQGLVDSHDESKLKADEFNGYRQYFFPEDGALKNKSMFAVAWLHHKNRNPHHWNYWILDREPLSMPFEYIIEMLLDWTAMSYKFNDCPMQFWEKTAIHMILHDDTIACIKNWIPLFKKQ